MARNKNDIETIQFTVSSTPPVQRYLTQLVKSGLYGKNAAEAAERLVTEKLRELMLNGTLRKDSKK